MEGVILIHDMQGEKISSGVFSAARRYVVGSSVIILRGELLLPIRGEITQHKDGKMPHNYYVKQDPTITLYCGEDDISPLNDDEFQLLEGIRSPTSRRNVFRLGNKLEWASTLHPDSMVYATIPGGNVAKTECITAVIRYIGLIRDQSGIQFGIEILDDQYRGLGTSDGTFRDDRYFTCEDKCGLFVSLEKISIEPTVPGTPVQRQSAYVSTNTSYADTARSSGAAHNAHSREKLESNVDKLSKGRKVIAYDRKGKKCTGVVQWIGQLPDIPYTYVGVRTDKKVRPADFEHALIGSTQYLMSTGRGYSLFVPKSLVTPVEAPTKRQASPKGPPQGDAQLGDTIATEFGVTHTRLVREEEEVLREAEEVKQFNRERRVIQENHPELAQVKSAIEATIDVTKQQQMLDEFNKVARRGSSEQRPLSQGDIPSQGLPNTQLPRQHSHRPEHIYDEPQFSPVTRHHPMGQRKSPSIAEGEGVHQKEMDTPQQDLSSTHPEQQLHQPHQGVEMASSCNKSKFSEDDHVVELPSTQGGTLLRRKKHSIHSIVQQYEEEMEEQFQNFSAEISNLTTKNEALQERVKHLSEQLDQVRCELTQQREDSSNTEQQLTEEAIRLTDQLKQQTDKSNELEEELKHTREDLSQQLDQVHEQLREAEGKRRQVEGDLREAVQQKAHLEQEVQDMETQKQLVEDELHQTLQQRDAFQQQLQEAETQRDALQQQLQEAEVQRQRVEENIVNAREHSAQLQHQLREEEDQRQQLQARVDTAIAYMRGEPLATQIGFDAIELWEIPRDEVQISNTILGTGGWGYVAKGTYKGQEVAVKCLHRGILSQYSINHVRREISIMTQVRHPNLLLFLGAVLSADTGPIIVTELLDRTLRSAYEENILEQCSKLPILRDVASALHYLHSHRRPIVHRDVSSANVLLDQKGNNTWRAKLSDFGSANLIRLATTPAEGAVPYSAPEVRYAENRSQQTPKVDVYSFGVLACEVTLCQFPPDPQEFAVMLEALRISCQSEVLFSLVRDCTQQEPGNRPVMSTVLARVQEAILQN